MAQTIIKGLILKFCNLNDNDRLFTVFSPGLGKITALSKGIRSHKHKDFAALQQFCYSELVLDDKKGLYYISSAQMLHNFYDIRTSVEKMSFATYFMDLVSNMSDELLYDDAFFSFILNTLYLTAKAGSGEKQNDTLTELKRLKAIFELKSVCSAGYTPQLHSCICCGKKKADAFFDLYNGGTVCSDCEEKIAYSQLVEINTSVLQMLLFICESDYREVFQFKAKEVNINLLSDICEEYLINKLEIYTPTLEYLKKIVYSV